MTTREGKAETLQAVAADYAGGIRDGNVTPVVIYDQNENVLGASQPLRYVALVTQTGTNDPVATEVFNNTGATITWARTGVGAYTAVASPSVFVDSKTPVVASNGTEEAGFVSGEYSNEATVAFRSWDATGSLADVIISNASIVIEIYP